VFSIFLAILVALWFHVEGFMLRNKSGFTLQFLDALTKVLASHSLVELSSIYCLYLQLFRAQRFLTDYARSSLHRATIYAEVSMGVTSK